MKNFLQFISNKAEDYIALRQSLGYEFKVQSSTIRAFCYFLKAINSSGPLTDTLALDYISSCDVTPNVRARRYGVLRHFAEYLSAFDIHTRLFASHAFPRVQTQPPARILNELELQQLLKAAQQISPRFPMRGNTHYTLIGLIASTGLRSGEALRLDRSDVDLESGVLNIRQTKFHKDRVVPVHETTRTALVNYAKRRDVVFTQPKSKAFFLSLRRGRLTSSGLCKAFHEARDAAGFGSTRPLRPHDLRHRFAVTRLVLWHREGVDVQVAGEDIDASQSLL
jgi:integrase